MERFLFFLVIAGILYTIYMMAQIDGFQDSGLNVPLAGPPVAQLPGEAEPFNPPSATLLAPPPGQIASVGSKPEEDPAMQKASADRINNVYVTIQGFLENEAPNIQSLGDPSVQLPLSTARADASRLGDEILVLKRNPGLESSLSLEDLNGIEANLGYLQKKWRLSTNSVVEPFDCGCKGPLSSVLNGLFGKSEGFANFPESPVYPNPNLTMTNYPNMPRPAGAPAARPAATATATAARPAATATAPAATATAPTATAARPAPTATAARPAPTATATAPAATATAARPTATAARPGAPAARPTNTSAQPSTHSSLNAHPLNLTPSNAHPSNMHPSRPGQTDSSPVTINDLKNLSSRIAVETVRLSASGTSNAVVQARVSKLREIKNKVDDMISQVQRGLKRIEDIPLKQSDIATFLPLMSNLNSPIPQILQTTGMNPALQNLFQSYSGGDAGGAQVAQQMFDKYAEQFLKNVSWELNITYTGQAEQNANKYEADSIASIAQLSANSNVMELTYEDDEESYPGQIQSVTQAMERPENRAGAQVARGAQVVRGAQASNARPRDPNPYDWKPRTTQICQQIAARGMKPADFGCVNPSSVSENFSWRGNAKMICSRLSTLHDSSIPAACGCPPVSWPGWRS